MTIFRDDRVFLQFHIQSLFVVVLHAFIDFVDNAIYGVVDHFLNKNADLSFWDVV